MPPAWKSSLPYPLRQSPFSSPPARDRPVCDANSLRKGTGRPLQWAVVGEHGETRPPRKTAAERRHSDIAKVQLGPRKGFHVFGNFLQIREDLSVHGDLMGRDEAAGCLILFNTCLPGPGVNGELIVDVDCQKMMLWHGSLASLVASFPPSRNCKP